MRRRSDRGIALLLALLLLALLIVLILQMGVTSLHNRTASDNQLADLQNTYGTRSGYHQALLYLQRDSEQPSKVDSVNELWASPIEFDLARAHVRVAIEDSDRFINLSRLTNDKGEANPTVAAQLRRLVRFLRHDPDAAERILDYVDADTKGNFEQHARNERLFNIEELLRVEGLTPEVLYGGMINGEEKKGIIGFVTIWPREPAPSGPAQGPEGPPPPGSPVNVNTAPAEVLVSLSDRMTIGLAEEIVRMRSLPGTGSSFQEFQSAEELKKVHGMDAETYESLAGQVAVQSSTFEIKVRSRVGNVEKAWVHVVRRGSGEKGQAELLGSQRVNDFLSVRPPETAETQSR